ncbi:complexin-like isoform X1 [Anneissia japonica]|uniref:complexin-like isoform X1 n=2 Tax=Anneissia japonica TaxID=1529436 RepID=UPI001425AFC6|nr:complexin-like isoform X1 [Anneissia japonica]
MLQINSLLSSLNCSLRTEHSRRRDNLLPCYQVITVLEDSLATNSFECLRFVNYSIIMASMAAKMILGNKLKSATGEIGKMAGGEEDEDEEDKEAQLLEERRLQEEERKQKHIKKEAEREEVRQEIRNKYGLKKKEQFVIPDDPGRLTRKKKTPEELAAAQNADDDEEGIMGQILSYVNPIASRFGFSFGGEEAEEKK